MIGQIKGFCILKSVESLITPGNPEDYRKAIFVRIMDISNGKDANGEPDGFLVIAPDGKSIGQIDRKDVSHWCRCCEFDGIIIPPELENDFLGATQFIANRRMRKGGYGTIVRNMVIMSCLHSGKFSEGSIPMEIDERYLINPMDPSLIQEEIERAQSEKELFNMLNKWRHGK
jgi:hypothetical protein